MVILNQPQALEEVHPVDLKGGEGIGVKEGKEVSEEVVVGRAEAVEGQGEGCGYQVFAQGIEEFEVASTIGEF